MRGIRNYPHGTPRENAAVCLRTFMAKLIDLFGKCDFEEFVVEILAEIKKQGEKIMSSVDELNAKLDAIPPVLDAIQADEEAQKVEIQALKDQIAAGTPVTQEQLDSLNAKADAVLARVQGIDASV